jgi:hypothetical protein
MREGGPQSDIAVLGHRQERASRPMARKTPLPATFTPACVAQEAAVRGVRSRSPAPLPLSGEVPEAECCPSPRPSARAQTGSAGARLRWPRLPIASLTDPQLA